MSEFQVVDVPDAATWGNGGRHGKWRRIAAGIAANRGKAIFIPRNGSKAITLRSNVHTQVKRYLKSDETLHTNETEQGVTVWLDEVQP